MPVFFPESRPTIRSFTYCPAAATASNGRAANTSRISPSTQGPRNSGKISTLPSSAARANRAQTARSAPQASAVGPASERPSLPRAENSGIFVRRNNFSPIRKAALFGRTPEPPRIRLFFARRKARLPSNSAAPIFSPPALSRTASITGRCSP